MENSKNEQQTRGKKNKTSRRKRKRLPDDVLNSLKDLTGFPNLAAMLQAETILRERKALNFDKMEEQNSNGAEIGALPQNIGDLKVEEQREKADPIQLTNTTETAVSPLAEDTMPSKLFGDLPAEEQREKSTPHELIETTRAALLPAAEDIMLSEIFVDAGDGNTCKNVSSSKPTESTSSVTEENTVLRKLLRGWRYFDSGDDNSHVKGHAAKSTAESQWAPCYLCGDVRHTGKKCRKRRTCYICNKRGHVARNCPTSNQEFDVCLRCGESGHDLFACENDYSPDDLKNIRCYICKEVGHLCCASYVEINPSTLSCYTCGECGHPGLQCPKPDVAIDAGVHQSRRMARRSKIYRKRLAKKRKMEGVQE